MIDTAFWLSVYVSTSYVAAIHTTSKGFEDYPSGRDDPRVIKRRMKGISRIMMLNMILVPLLIHTLGSPNNEHSFKDAFLNLGLIPGRYRDGHWDLITYIGDVCKSIALIALLYVGPLTDSLLYYVFVPDNFVLKDIKNEIFSIWGIRNYLFAPLTEELFYTSMLMNTYLSLYPNELTYKMLIWQTPLFFGLAHMHHAYEMYQEGTSNLPTICFNTIIQTIYTTLFGSLTNYAFLRTGGNLWACVVLHSLCNYFGFPESSRLVMHYTIVKTSKSIYVNKMLNIWKKCYIALLFMGVLFFKNNYSALTSSWGNAIEF